MRRKYITVSLDPDLVDWLDGEVDGKRFRNRSHGVDLALKLLKNGPPESAVEVVAQEAA